ncbi:hypothetical protein OG320_17805 [Microbispora sp. NBC_01189]|uniref:hypothetical protein n=1 Tax=Microbispora sp. NBC_01189 TaxID=2903583 RepID=UPI002E10000B|nr:hypothetical protein OG320_17805 [Microbispora sp. NBC_01189]
MAALALGLAGTAAVVVPAMTATASTADLVVDYACNQGIASSGSGTVYLRTKLTVPTTLNVGDPLNVGWNLAYRDATRFGAPALLPNGGRIYATGEVNLSDGWKGQLQPVGNVDQAGAMKKGTPLTLPTTISDFAYTTRAGTVTVKPGNLYVDFRPPASEVMVNDDDLSITYSAGDWTDVNDRPSGDNDYHLDYHRTNKAGAWAALTFTGTGIEYVAQRDRHAGPVEIWVDNQLGTPPRVEPNKKDDGTLVNDSNVGGQTLWSFTELEYGEHTISIKSAEDKRTLLDAFRVITGELPGPPPQYRATCTLISAPVAVQVTIAGGNTPTSPSTSPDTSPPASPDTSGSPSSTPDGNSPPPDGNSPSPSVSPSTTPSPTPPVAATQSYLTSVVVKGSPSPTATRTVTLTATPTVAQVAVTPKDGAQTGEAPERMAASGPLLLGSGGALLTIGVLSGVALLRRRAAHAGERA